MPPDTERSGPAGELHPRLSVSQMCTPTWSLDQDLAFWQDAGIGYVGVAIGKVTAQGWDAGLDKLRAARPRISSLMPGGGFHLDRPEGWADGRTALCRAVDAAVSVGAENVFMSAGPPGRISTEAAEGAFAEAIGPVSAYAAERDMPLALEHNNTLRRDLGFIHSLADAIDYCRDIGFGVCVEINNCWIERRPEELFRRGVDLFRIVQVSDFVVGTVDTPNRAVPGDGDIPLERLIGSLLEAGYEGPFELEALGPRIEAEGYRSAVLRGAAWVSDLLGRLGA